jgi:RNA 2',3'-cyclic 3'-phosphodiesterase
VRLFLAINFQPEVRRAVIEATSDLRAAAPTLNWMDESRLHITLKFLGEQEDTVVTSLGEALDGVARRHREFSIRIADVGAFPNFRRARVVWMGVDRESRLELLHHDVEQACEALGFGLEGRAFRPHLTLARVREGTPEEELRVLSRAARRVDFECETEVHAIDLMRSNTGRGGSRYDRLHSAVLRAP